MSIDIAAGLPIAARTDEIVGLLREHPVLVVAGDTGSGKTTQLPKMCLLAGRRRIVCTQPRRIAAVSVAARLAEELGESLGGLVGYKIRFQDRTSRQTRIKFVTDGVLLAELQRDRRLAAYDTIIIDEAHERSCSIDFLLGVVKRLLGERPDLKVIVTSATIDTDKFAAHFGSAPVVYVEGRTFPVEIRYRPPDPDESHVEAAVAAALELHESADPGDILVFLPTESDIREAVSALEAVVGTGSGAKRPATVLPLFGRLAGPDQARIFRPAAGRKIVVATNVAETSLTVPGIRFVVDTGLARIPIYSVRARTTRMPVTRVCRASCDQRAGRCGRLGPGVCIRLYSEEDYLARPLYQIPEIQRTNLAEVILRMLALGLGEPADFPFVDPPASRTIQDGYRLLEEVGALTDEKGKRRLTRRGRFMARLPLDPRLARIIIEAREQDCLREAVVIVAVLSIMDPRVRPAEQEGEADAAHATFFGDAGSDYLGFLRLWEAYAALSSRSAERRFCRRFFLSWQRMREWRDVHDQIWRILDEEKGFIANRRPADPDTIHRTILSGFLRGIALHKEKQVYEAVGNRPCRIHPGSAVKGGTWIMAAELVETSQLFARMVAPIDPAWIEPLAGRLCRYQHGEPFWSKRRGQVVVRERVTLFGLPVVAGRLVSCARIDRQLARRIFIESALVGGELGGRYPFLEHNRQLLAELEAMEDRLRSREVLVDEATLFSLYDQRLPETVYDRRSLDRWLRTQGDGGRKLFFDREQLIRALPDADVLCQFPGELECDTVRLPLEYRFAPGDEADGVTVVVPVDLVDRLDRDRFDWLVPGMLEEKIAVLLRGLPKAVRRRLVPVNETAAWLAGQLPFADGNLYRRLEEAIARRYGVTVRPADWPRSRLPAQYQMRFRLVRGRRTLLATRDFDALVQNDAAGSNLEDACRAATDRHGGDYGPEVFDCVPEQVPLEDRRGRLLGFGYRLLEEAGTPGRVRVRFVSDRYGAMAASRTAVLGLYRAGFSRQWKEVRRALRLPANRWFLLDGLAVGDDAQAALQAFVLENLFGLRAGLPESRAEFDARAADVRHRGLYPAAMELFEKLCSCLEQRHQLRTRLAELPRQGMIAEAVQEIEAHLAELVPAAFLAEADTAALVTIPRRLRAVAIRIDRLLASPAKDRQKAAQLRPHLERLASCRQEAGMPEAKRRLVGEYREMIEEFRISLFAQEVKTAFPVSAKRLDALWRRIEGYC